MLGLAGGRSHPHRQLKCPLCSDRGVDSGFRRRERSNDSVAGVAEQLAAMCLNR